MTEQNNESFSTGLYHAVGIVLVIAVYWMVHHVYQVDMLGGTEVESSQWQLGLGLCGGALVAALIIFPMRRRLRRGPAQGFEPWMVLHSYLGVVAGIILLHHGFFNFSLNLRGILLAALMLTIVLGFVALILRKRLAAGVESTLLKKISLYHRVFSVLTGILLVVHVLFDAVVRQ